MDLNRSISMINILKRLPAVLLLLLSSISFSYSQDKVDIILIGTYHFNNPGNDAAKTTARNILSEKDQMGLEELTNAINKKSRPDQIFVESPHAEAKKLNEIYQLYLSNDFNKFTDTIGNKRLQKLYIEGETFQLAFRLGKKSNNKEVFPIDTMIQMRFDLLSKELNANPVLKAAYDNKLGELSKGFNEGIGKESMRDVLLRLNEEDIYFQNKSFYISLANKVGVSNGYFGSILVSDWYKRNLLMFANIQSQLKKSTKTAVILVGVGHAAMFREFFKNDPNFNLVELKDIL